MTTPLILEMSINDHTNSDNHNTMSAPQAPTPLTSALNRARKRVTTEAMDGSHETDAREQRAKKRLKLMLGSNDKRAQASEGAQHDLEKKIDVIPLDRPNQMTSSDAQDDLIAMGLATAPDRVHQEYRPLKWDPVVKKMDANAYKLVPTRLLYNDSDITFSADDKMYYRDRMEKIGLWTSAHTVLAPKSLIGGKENRPSKVRGELKSMGQPKPYSEANLEEALEQPLRLYGKENILMQQNLIVKRKHSWRAYDAKAEQIIGEDHPLCKKACKIIEEFLNADNNKWYDDELTRAEREDLPEGLLRDDSLVWAQRRPRPTPQTKHNARRGSKRKQSSSAKPVRQLVLILESQCDDAIYFKGFGDAPAVEETNYESAMPEERD